MYRNFLKRFSFFILCISLVYVTGHSTVTANAATVTNQFTEYIEAMTGEDIYTEIYVYGEPSGACTFKLSGSLPDGVTITRDKKNNQQFILKGKINQVINGSEVQMTITDKKGNQFIQPIRFYVGSKEQIITYCIEDGMTIIAGDKQTERFVIYAVGGSGKYTLQFTPQADGKIKTSPDYDYTSYDEEEGFILETADSIAKGTYQVSYTVKDNKNASCKTESAFTINVEPAVKVSGKFLTKDGKTMKNLAQLLFTVQGEKNWYQDVYNCDVKKNGSFTVYLASSATYKAEAYLGSMDLISLGKVKTGNKNMTLKQKTSYYKITLKSTKYKLSDDIIWFKKAKDVSVGAGKELYLKKGKYNLEAGVDNPQEKYSYSYTASFKVSKSKTVKAKSTRAKRMTLKAGTNKKVPFNQFLVFKPSETKKYKFVSSKISGQVSAYLWDKEDVGAISEDIAYADNGNGKKAKAFKLEQKLKKGNTYYLLVFGKEGKTLTLTIS